MSMKNNKFTESRLRRLERKCDRILVELLVLKRVVQHQRDVDDVIDRLHNVAVRMREQSERERTGKHSYECR